MNRPDNITACDDLAWSHTEQGDHFAAKRKSLSAATGARELGCSLYELPPGKSAWPMHAHMGNEEAVFVLEGSGTLRHANGESAISAGDYLSFPRGKDHAHQIVNTSDSPLRYLCISTMNEPDIGWYPNSRKFGLFAGSAPGGDQSKRSVQAFLPEGAQVEYWEGE